MCGVNSTEFSHLTAGNFEKSLASDELLVHFFNNFLSLPTFPESLVYNQETGLFEVATGAAGFVSSRIQSVLHYSKSQFLTGDPTVLARTPPVDNNYSVSCLNREQGFQWVVKERLPFFLQSDYYSEYRLAKLFHQNLNLCIQRRKYSTGTTDDPVTGLPSGKKEPINTKCYASPICSPSLSDLEKPCPASCLLSTSSSSCPNIKFEKAQELQRPQIVPSLGNPQDEHVTDSSSQTNNSSEVQLERLAVTVVKQVLHNSLTVMDGRCLANTSESFFSLSGDNVYCTSTIKSCECNIFLQSATGVQDREKMREEKVQKDKRHTGVEEKTELEKMDWKEEGRGRHKKTVFDCCHGILCHSSRLGLDEFKEFLRGTQGEKMFSLWMDIERLKCTQNRQRKNRYLALMRSWYLLSSSHSCLNVELLARLGLTTPPCWTEEKLHSVQPILTEALLYYWAPRFWSSPYVHDEDTDDPSHVGVWADWCVSPLSGVQSHYDYLTMPPADHEHCNPLSPDTILTQFHSGRGQSLGSRRIENLLQALSVDMCAGSYITTFCEQSGNQLWENAINCWTDLQHYRELFYHDGLDPYRVQREAQLLYSTYLLTSARRTIDVDDEMRREAYSQMTPAFEELFDSVEEHILSILLEPWTLLVNRDKGSLQKVCVWEEVRRVESREYRELQCLYEESERRLKQMEQWDSVILHSSVTPSRLHSKGPTVPDSWANVPPNYHGYRLGSILRYPDEISHFMSFLQDKGASIHLSCWLDLDRYRRSSQKGEAVRQERSSFIATEYLNRKYFFGSDSPATVQQQNDILHLAGGLERLTLDCLPNSVVIEIQNIIRSHIEEKWLPLFLSTTEFTERRKQQLKCQAADGASQHVHRRRRARTAAWKHGGLWMTSSKEILLFRRTLLNPVTCLQFQHFVALKGEFLENDVLFWLEVQRYKDLCHSHSDDLTIQKKISTIINCFINSSLPPALQIDIPPEQALHILEKRKKLGPYIFREAQMSVFSELLKLWPEFQELSSRVQEEQLLPLLQEKRVKHRARVRRQRRKEEEAEEEEESERRRAQAELVRPKSSGAAGEEEERDEEDEEVNRKEKRQLKAERSRTSPTQTQPLSWSYSKYMAALKREEELLRRQNQPEASFSMALDSSSDCSIKSAGSNVSRLQPLRRPTDGKQRDRYNRGVRVCNNQRVK